MKTFKIFTIGCFALLLLGSGLASAQNKSEKSEKVQRLLESKDFIFIAESANPMGGGNIRLTSSYYQLSFNKDSLDSFLPYFGTAYRAQYGTSQSPLIFTSSNFTYDTRTSKSGNQILTFKINEPNDPSVLTLTVSSSGYGTLQVGSIHRQPISFYGVIEPNTKNAN